MRYDKKKIDTDNAQLIDSYDYMSGSASTQDCTGLIPANPLPGDVMEAYEAIYPYAPPEISPRSKKQND